MEFTINLLPPEKKRALHSGIIIATMESILLFFLILLVIFAVTLLSLRFVLSGVQKDLASRSQQVSSETASPETEIRTLDTYLKRVDVLQQKFIRWSDVFVGISAATPKGVRILSIDVTKDGEVTLRGIAPTRDDVLAYDDALRKNGLFSDVSSPLSNLLQKTDVAFVFKATYKPLADQKL